MTTKGKQKVWESDEDDEEAYATPNDIGSPVRREREKVTENGNGFGEGGDDEGLYDD